MNLGLKLGYRIKNQQDDHPRLYIKAARSLLGDERISLHSCLFEVDATSLLDWFADRTFCRIFFYLSTIPLDLLVESTIKDLLTDHRPDQERYLQEQFQVNTEWAYDKLLLNLPKTLHRAENALCLAYTMGVAPLAKNSLRQIPFNPYQQLADRLLKYLPEARTRGPLAEQYLIDTWASELDVNDWYYWSSNRKTGNPL